MCGCGGCDGSASRPGAYVCPFVTHRRKLGCSLLRGFAAIGAISVAARQFHAARGSATGRDAAGHGDPDGDTRAASGATPQLGQW